jgi:hypothetical protein
MKSLICGTLIAAVVLADAAACASELTIAEAKRCDYQIVVPDDTPEEVVNQALAQQIKITTLETYTIVT